MIKELLIILNTQKSEFKVSVISPYILCPLGYYFLSINDSKGLLIALLIVLAIRDLLLREHPYPSS